MSHSVRASLSLFALETLWPPLLLLLLRLEIVAPLALKSRPAKVERRATGRRGASRAHLCCFSVVVALSCTCRLALALTNKYDPFARLVSVSLLVSLLVQPRGFKSSASS